LKEEKLLPIPPYHKVLIMTSRKMLQTDHENMRKMLQEGYKKSRKMLQNASKVLLSRHFGVR